MINRLIDDSTGQYHTLASAAHSAQTPIQKCYTIYGITTPVSYTIYGILAKWMMLNSNAGRPKHAVA